MSKSIVDRERTIVDILSVVQRNYPNKKERQRKLLVRRKQDLLVYVLEGESFYEFEDESLSLKAGDVLFLARDCRYQRKIRSENYRTIYIYFNFENEAEDLPVYQLFRGVDGIDMSFMRVYKKWTSHALGYRSESLSLLYQLYAQLIRAEQSAYLPKAKQEQFDRAVHFISETYTDANISVVELAETAGMSEVHFRRCFRKIYKVSPQEYITALRITYAKEQLQFSSHSMEEIAKSSGFADPGYFTRVFKQKTGFTPSEYRRQIESRSEQTEKKYEQ